MAELLLDSLEIKGYRCFEHLTIEKLGRVNLIVGKNNVGKTALLEALWIWANKGDKINDILIRRDENSSPPNFSKDYRNNFYKVLYCFFNADTNSFSVSESPNKKICNLKLDTNGNFNYRTEGYEVASKVFIQTDGLDNNKIVELWDKIELRIGEEETTRSMKMLLPKLQKVRLLNTNSGRIAYAQVSDVEEPLSLKSFGDGLNRLFGISLTLANCKDGILIIDEIENGFHYSILPDVWKLIFKTAKDLNVQVFATTHSKDCIEAFTQAAIDDEESEGMLIRLERKDDEIKALTFDEKELETISRRDIEVR
ncbi:MAG: AAA family ATPase [Pyrinomonadaceae bacterium]|nr:AAA family ATPase [Pyrinomonadaceae bacterium]